jgi:hypothetical protein
MSAPFRASEVNVPTWPASSTVVMAGAVHSASMHLASFRALVSSWKYETTGASLLSSSREA